ncbi:MAG TPA: hypothetical protein ENN20_11595 [Candidatus Marinimicrobia bacterium]|nr:hypothetical protein [Candidatus Neomarinimicrobiota bacterium]
MKIKTFLFILCILTGLTYSQSVVGEWSGYTSVLNVRDVLTVDHSIYAGSSGGLVCYNQLNGEFRIYSIGYGLTKADIQCLAQDPQGRLWLGMSNPDGEINIWDIQKEAVTTVFNAFEFGDELTCITAIVFTGNRAYAAYQYNVDWGIAYFKMQNDEYRYQDRFEAFPINVSGINSLAVINDTLWLATPSGLLYADLNQTDLKTESAWKAVDLPETGYVSRVVTHQGRAVFNLNQALFTLNNLNPELLDNSLNRNITDLIMDRQGELYAVTTSGVYHFDAGIWRRVISVSVSKAVFNDDNELFGGSATRCLWQAVAGKPEYLIPNTILDNIYTALWVNEDGSLMAGTQKGFSLLTEQGWYNICRSNRYILIHDETERDWKRFVADTIAFSLTSRVYNLDRNKNGDYFVPLYGSYLDHYDKHGNYIDYLKEGGLLRFNPDNLGEYILYDTTDNKLEGSAGRGGHDYYLGIGYIALDTDENLWIANQYAQNDNVIAVLTNDDQWVHFNIEESGGYLNYHTTSIIFDEDGRVWFASEVHTGETPSPAAGGIIVLDHKGSLFDKSDDEWTWITTSHGLASNAVYSIAFDRSGDLWIMTSDGIQRASVSANFPNRIFSSIDNAVLTSVPFAKECRIKVDRLNNKWISTVGFGVKVYTYDGIWLNDVEGFTAENSGLLSNTVNDIAFNNAEGLVYFATNKGISVYKSAYAVYGDKYRELKIFPMPYEIPATRPLVIDGLLQESEVKIITLDGTFVRKLSYLDGDVVGQQAFWDGKDHRGRYVSSGVYLCMAYTKEGDTTVGKIAIVRK